MEIKFGRSLMEALEDLKKRMADGEDICKIMEDTYSEIQRLAEYKKEINKLKQKSNYQLKIINAIEKISNFDLDRKLTEYVSLLDQIKLDNSELANNKGFKDILNEMKKASEKLQAAKSYYNKYTSELNDLIRTFPSNLVARLHAINIKPFFDGKNMEDEIVDDFKL